MPATSTKARTTETRGRRRYAAVWSPVLECAAMRSRTLPDGRSIPVRSDCPISPAWPDLTA